VNQEDAIIPDEMNIACVRWVDASAYPGWREKLDSEPSELLEVQSVGWLIRRNDKVVVLAMSVNEYKIGDLLVIPAQSIIDIHHIK
jgi:hypothetical protein